MSASELDLGGGTLTIKDGVHILENVVVGAGKTFKYGNEGQTVEIRGTFKRGPYSTVVIGNGGGKLIGADKIPMDVGGATIIQNGPGFPEDFVNGLYSQWLDLRGGQTKTRKKRKRIVPAKKDASSSDEDSVDNDDDDGDDEDYIPATKKGTESKRKKQ